MNPQIYHHHWLPATKEVKFRFRRRRHHNQLNTMGSIVGFPPSAISQDPSRRPRASGKSILAKRYIQSEDNTTMNAAMEEEEQMGGGARDPEKEQHTYFRR